jgi:hypothetical protein
MTELIEAVARRISVAMFGHDCVPTDGNLSCAPGSRLHTVLQAAQAALTAITDAGYRIVPGWQPIETAPKDGTFVLLYCEDPDPEYEPYCIQGWFESGAFDNRWYEAHSENPIRPSPRHWMPLPAAPVDEK